MMVRRAFVVLLMICLGCSAQAPPSAPTPSSAQAPALPGNVVQQMERQLRAHYSLPPDVKLIMGSLRASEFSNYDALTITFNSPEKKQSFDFLLSRDHKTLVRITKMNLDQDPYAETMKKIDVNGRPTRGNKDAKVTLVNYDDFECPFCSRMHSTLFPEILKEYGDRVLFIYKDYPLEEIHPWAVHAAVDANCLNAQAADAYWDYADYLHGNQHAVSAAKGKEGQNDELDKQAMLQAQKHHLDEPKLQACLKTQDQKVVRASMKEGEAVGVNATPTLFVNGQKLDGAVPADEIRAVLDRALKDAGVAPPEHKPASAEAKTPAPAPSK
jgi:protein-disulfide isomerase